MPETEAATIAYVRPASLAEACERLCGPGAVPYAGGSDLLVAFQERASLADGVRTLVDIKHLLEAQGIERRDGLLRIGALATAAVLASDGLVRVHAPALAQAAFATAAPAIRRRATLGGNICTPHPAGDMATALLGLDAELETATVAARRRFALAALLAGETHLATGEIVLAVWLRDAPGSAFAKFGLRLGFCRAIVSAAVVSSEGGGRLRAALGGVAARPIAAPFAAEALRRDADLAVAVARDCDPADDAVASRGYRLRLAATLLRRCASAATAEPGVAEGRGV